MTTASARTLTKEELWQAYVARNPQFDGDGTVTMTAAGLRKLFEQTWQFAHDKGVANGRAAAELDARKSGAWCSPPGDPSDPMIRHLRQRCSF